MLLLAFCEASKCCSLSPHTVDLKDTTSTTYRSPISPGFWQFIPLLGSPTLQEPAWAEPISRPPNTSPFCEVLTWQMVTLRILGLSNSGNAELRPFRYEAGSASTLPSCLPAHGWYLLQKSLTTALFSLRILSSYPAWRWGVLTEGRAITPFSLPSATPTAHKLWKR